MAMASWCVWAMAMVARAEPTVVVDVEQVAWGALNSARGDASPRAADLWGQRAEPGPAGFLVRFVHGFSSPPHVHNVGYRAIVLEGSVHNDHPAAPLRWMPPGSFWTQPEGGLHITAAQGASMVLVEVDDGPYLVHPPDQAREAPSAPLNLATSNLVWVPADAPGHRVTYLWGDPLGGEGGAFVAWPAGGTTSISGHGASVTAVVVRGSVGATPKASLRPGSLATSASLSLRCAEGPECVVYVKSSSRGIAVGDAAPAGGL